MTKSKDLLIRARESCNARKKFLEDKLYHGAKGNYAEKLKRQIKLEECKIATIVYYACNHRIDIEKSE